MSWGNVIVAGGSLIAGYMGSQGADAEGDAAQDGLDFTKGVYADAQGNFSPYLGQGQAGVDGLNRLANGDYSGFENSPDYQFRVQQANKQYNDGAAAKYNLFSGGAQNDRDALNQGLASEALGQYRQSLQYLATSGQNAAGTLGGIGSQTSQQVNGQYGAIGDAAASKYGSYAGAITGVAGAANNYMQGRQGNGSSYGGGSNASQYGLPSTVQPYANTNWGSGGNT